MASILEESMEVAQLRQELRRARRDADRLGRLNELVRMFAPDMRRDELVLYVHECLDVAGSDRGFAVLRDRDGTDDAIAVGMRVYDALGVAAMTEELVFGSAGAAAERFPTLDAPASLVALPLVAVGRTVGSFAIAYTTPQLFTDDDLAFLRTVAATLAHTVARVQTQVALHRTAKKNELAARRAKGLSDASRLMAGPDRTLDESLADLVRVACESLGDCCILRTLAADGKSLEMRAAQHRDPAGEALVRATMMAPIPVTPALAEVIATGKPLVMSGFSLATLVKTYPAAADFARQFPISSLMHVPLRSREGVFGLIGVIRHEGRCFDDDDLRFLVDLADRAALSLGKSKLRKQLQHSEHQLRVALDAGRLGAWEWDIAAGRVSWSPRIEEIHGIPVGSFSGTFEAFQHDIHPEDRDRVLASIAMILERKVDHHMQYRIVRPDGEVRWLEAHGKLVFDADGRPERLIGVCSDVTERCRSEEQLRATMLALKEADQRKDQFLSMLAHELRNPLGPMLNSMHLLATPGITADLSERALQILERQVRHMARLLDDLLDVSRITRGKIELRRERLDLVALAIDVLADVSEAVRMAGLRCEIESGPEPIHVFADPTRVAQVIGNMLSNAIKFSDRGTIRVHIARHGDAATIAIRDEGIGVEPAVLERMFEPFVQADSSLSRGRGGLGLGLAVVRGLVALHGGRVTARSDGANRGTEIRIELPLAPAMDAPARVDAPVVRAAEATRVLVFEDNSDAAESLREILSRAGHQVAVENTGARALEVIRAFHPQVVLCDLGLPEKDGYTIASEVRSDTALSGLRMIALSGYGAREDLVRSKRAGFDVHLTKPVPPQLVLSEISKSCAEA